MSSLRVAVFASGSGSNFEALAKAFQSSDSIDIVLCVTNRPGAGVLERARKLDVESVVISPSSFNTSDEYVTELLKQLDERRVNFIALAGYLKMIPGALVERFRNRIVNIHPALLPAFGGKGMYGRHVHEAVIKSGAQWSGVTIHIVDEEYDTGPIVLQEPVPVGDRDTPEDLAARVLKVEHRIYPRALELFGRNEIEVIDRRVVRRQPSQDQQ